MPLVAAVDLGSNSFHMVIARVRDTELLILDRLRERVQLAAGLGKKGRLSDEAQARALGALERFGERLRDIPSVRAVGTNTLRKAKNSRQFLTDACKALGHPIEVVSGREEARLIYLGVAHTTPDESGRRLVVDIGGGSTECILGERFEPLLAESLHMGCVSFSKRFFPDGEMTRERFKQAEIAAQLELQTIRRRFTSFGWDMALGTSGTILAIHDLSNEGGALTRPGLRKLRKSLIAAGNISQLKLPGLRADRANVLPGGLAILSAVFESLGVERLGTSDGALREGLLYDLLGRFRHEDVRGRTIQNLEERYHVDREQGARVQRTALRLLEAVAGPWKLNRLRHRQLLGWAARLHEIGMTVAYSSYHKHGGYLLTHSDLPGFSIDERRMLASLVRSHRRKLQRDSFADAIGLSGERQFRLCLLLRLAVVLNRSRSPRTPKLGLEVSTGKSKSDLQLTMPAGFSESQPLTIADLEREANVWRDSKYKLRIRDRDPDDEDQD